jgi:hypothetical protein
MSDFSKVLTYLFILALVLIAVAYYAGVQTDARAFANAFQTIQYSITGRNSSGQFAAYPGGYTSAG